MTNFGQKTFEKENVMKKTTCTEKNIFSHLAAGTVVLTLVSLFGFVVYQFVIFYTILAGGATPYWIPLLTACIGGAWFFYAYIDPQKSNWINLQLSTAFVWATLPISINFLAKGASLLGYAQSAKTFFEYRYTSMWYALPVLILFILALFTVITVRKKASIKELFLIHLDEEIMAMTATIIVLNIQRLDIEEMYPEGSIEALLIQNEIDGATARKELLLERRELALSL